MEDIMVAGAFGCARNYGGDGPFKKSYLLHDAVGARHADLPSTNHSDFPCWYFILCRDCTVLHQRFFHTCGHCVLMECYIMKMVPSYQKVAIMNSPYYIQLMINDIIYI